MADATLDFLINLIDQAYNKKAWHGPNLRSALRSVDAKLAAKRPHPQRHNIWEQALHAAYWKYIARRRLLKEKKGSFPLSGSNWITRPVTLSESAWQDDLQLLEECHQSLRKAVTEFDPKKLLSRLEGSENTYYQLLSGIACHDIYHAGQIMLIRKILES